MANSKLSSKPSKPKRYDFETPLDPFEGESLKGIVAFIQSSVTLQPQDDSHNLDTTHPPPHLETVTQPAVSKTVEPASTHLSEVVLGTLNSSTTKPSLSISSTPLTSISSLPINSNVEGLMSAPSTGISSVLDTNKTKYDDLTSYSSFPISESAFQGNRPSGDKLIDKVITSIPDTPILGVPVITGNIPISGVLISNPTQAPIGLGTPSAAESSPKRLIYLRIRMATRGQDGLNKGEHKIYTFLWSAVYRPKDLGGRSGFNVTKSTIEISLRDLARKVGLGLANCAWHIRCLEEKGCVFRVRESDHYHPAVYQVREFSDILQWRKEHGLTHFIQRGHLATFIDPRTGDPITRFRRPDRHLLPWNYRIEYT